MRNGVKEKMTFVLWPPSPTRWVGVKSQTVGGSFSEMMVTETQVIAKKKE